MNNTIDTRLMVAIFHHPKYPTDVFNEVHFEADLNAPVGSSQSVKGQVQRIIRESGLTTPRQNPQSINVKVMSIVINPEGKLERILFAYFDIIPRIAKMNEDEFQEEQIQMLKDIPKAFHEPLTNVAWDKGHHEGFEEVISELSYLITEFTPAIRAYKEFLENEPSDYIYNNC